MRLRGRIPPLLLQGIAERPEARARVQDESEPFAEANLNAGSVSATDEIAGVGRGDASAHSPELQRQPARGGQERTSEGIGMREAGESACGRRCSMHASSSGNDDCRVPCTGLGSG